MAFVLDFLHEYLRFIGQIIDSAKILSHLASCKLFVNKNLFCDCNSVSNTAVNLNMGILKQYLELCGK